MADTVPPGLDEFPKWIDVDGPGHPDVPGKVLVGSKDEEREAKKTGVGPESLNPPVDPNAPDKDIADMSREELVATLIKESITDAVSDDQLRDAIQAVRERGGKPTVFGGDEPNDIAAPPGKDAAGDERAPDVSDLANNKKSTKDSPDPKAKPGTLADDSDDKAKAKTKPATDGVAAAGGEDDKAK